MGLALAGVIAPFATPIGGLFSPKDVALPDLSVVPPPLSTTRAAHQAETLQPFAIARSRSQGWLRAAVLGANDGILSTASLIAGVAAAHPPASHIMLAGLSAAVAGALSMATGEYVSVSSQADSEKADLARLGAKLHQTPDVAVARLAGVYERHGVSPALARRVAEELSARDPLAAHARDALGISPEERVYPLQNALTAALTFSSGAIVPLVVAAAAAHWWPDAIAGLVMVSSLIALGILGGLGARMGGASIVKGALRVMFWGAAAMAATSVIGHFFGHEGA